MFAIMNAKFSIYMKTSTFRALVVAVFAGFLVLGMSSCKKRSDYVPTAGALEDVRYSVQHTNNEQALDDVLKITDEAAAIAASGSGKFQLQKYVTDGCVTITNTDSTRTIDFGASTCVYPDGRFRTGKIIVTYSGGYFDSGSVHDIRLEGYHQNTPKTASDMKGVFTGTISVVNKGHNALQQMESDIAVNCLSRMPMYNGDTATITLSWTRSRTQINGAATSTNMNDDTYALRGEGSTTWSTGEWYTLKISVDTPIILSVDCSWVRAGVVVYTLSDNTKRTLYYDSFEIGGNAGCNQNIFLLTKKEPNYSEGIGYTLQ